LKTPFSGFLDYFQATFNYYTPAKRRGKRLAMSASAFSPKSLCHANRAEQAASARTKSRDGGLRPTSATAATAVSKTLSRETHANPGTSRISKNRFLNCAAAASGCEKT